MAKRSPWKTQAKSQIRKLRYTHSQPAVSPDYSAAVALIRKGTANATPEEKAGVISKHSIPAIKKFGLPVMKDTAKQVEMFREMARMLDRLEPEQVQFINNLAMLSAQETVRKERPGYYRRVTEQVEKYLTERKIQVDRQTLDAAVNYYFIKHPVKTLTEAINVAEIEKGYLEFRKSERAARIDDATELNTYYRKVTAKMKLTPNQKAQAKRLVRQTIKKFNEEMAETFRRRLRQNSGQVTQTVISSIGEMQTNYIIGLRRELEKNFVQQQKSPGAKPQIGQLSKLGTRRERLENYVPREKTPRQRADELEQTKLAAVAAGRPYSTVEDCLAQITQNHTHTGQELRRMLTRDLLRERDVVSLFTSGSNTQRLFMQVVEKTDFVERFGSRQINVLAKGLAYIGPFGAKITAAKRAFQSNSKEEIFSFLQRNGVLEIHSGGRAVYLAR